ncbi:MAG TPA: selenocysteine-specific translation elongation factor [Candidatus Limnocylindria bacterium]|jgi:selenocysteine-specific elongation factor|nr:selenocysteine-specific translation elongation factor [Candidatus Limnocylindria bacterium]
MSIPTKSVIVGTAGHIDHGKSTLVEALTGTHPDRLAEEKRRGITIDLGFAFLEENGVRFGFVDVPGHERFVSNMLAGAAGIDVLLLVIAADESVKPQTREHFDICRLLGVQRGVVALTKSDTVDSETLELVRMEAEEFLCGSFLEKAPLVAVSAKTGAGLGELKKALTDAAEKASAKDAARYFRLPIDRAFAIKGFGSVVTGTLISGSVGPGDEVELFPRGERLRVRGVQSGGKTVERATPGQRTAVNLAGIEHTALKRGMVLAAPGKFRKTRRIDVRLELLPSARKMKQGARVHFHTGTVETIAEIFFHGEKELPPGASAVANLKLQEEVLALPGDRFIVRQFSPVVTIGGGAVLDPLARRPMLRDKGRTAFLETLERQNGGETLAAMTERAVLGLGYQEIVARTGWTEKEIQGAVEKLHGTGRIRTVSSEPLVLLSGKLFEEVRKKITEKVERFQKENPLLPGISREDLRTSLGKRVRSETFRAALEELAAQKKLDARGELVKKTGSEITLLAEEARAKEQIEAAFARASLAVPSVKEVLAKLTVEAKRAEKLLQILLREKNLLRVSPELVFHCQALAQLKEQLSAYKKAKGDRISVPAFKELTGITRKYAIPLLEYLDREHVTRRVGEERVIL